MRNGQLNKAELKQVKAAHKILVGLELAFPTWGRCTEEERLTLRKLNDAACNTSWILRDHGINPATGEGL